MPSFSVPYTFLQRLNELTDGEAKLILIGYAYNQSDQLDITDVQRLSGLTNPIFIKSFELLRLSSVEVPEWLLDIYIDTMNPLEVIK